MEASQGTVRILCDDKETALGTVVGADGWILTKYSQLTGKPVCKLKDGKKLDAKIVGVQEAFDLALLKVEGTGLHAVVFTDSKVAPVGSWLVSVGMSEEPVAVGVMSVAARTPPPVMNRGPGRSGNNGTPAPDYLGVNVASDGATTRVVRVAGQSAAAKAGVKVDDQILSIQGSEITDQRSLSALLAKMKVGDSVAIKLLRDGKEMELKAKLEPASAPDFLGVNVSSDGPIAKVIEVARRSAAERAGIRTGDQIVSIQGSAVNDQKTLLSVLGKMKPGDTVKIKLMREGKEKELEARLQQRGQPQRQDQNLMGSELSEKRTGFPTYFQSDTVLKPKDCGGPICDLEGHVIGINIARAGRVESYSIPASSLTTLLPELKSGKLSPEILALRKRITELKAIVRKATEEKAAADKKLQEAQSAVNKPATEVAELDKKLKAAQVSLEKAEKQLNEKK
ncbi:MAG TPA: PDZ domain-containing protein [Gemmataceae bacterium]|nr:PDZ domain-containing protein [Gemmataceae bacterium]